MAAAYSWAFQMADIESVRQLLKTATVAGGVDEKSIHDAEGKLGIRFPPSYKQFLSEFGAAICNGFEFAGLIGSDDDEPPLWSNVVTATFRLRRIPGGLPNEYVPVSDDGGDYHFYLDTSRPNAHGECPVIVLGPGADAVIVADDFFDFVHRSFADSLSF